MVPRAYRIASFTYWNVNNLLGEEDKHKQARRLADNFTLCSCQSCRNPRHSHYYSKKEKLTIQERKANLILLL